MHPKVFIQNSVDIYIRLIFLQFYDSLEQDSICVAALLLILDN